MADPMEVRLSMVREMASMLASISASFWCSRASPAALSSSSACVQQSAPLLVEGSEKFGAGQLAQLAKVSTSVL
jgi:hypothetical protein